MITMFKPVSRCMEGLRCIAGVGATWFAIGGVLAAAATRSGAVACGAKLALPIWISFDMF
jgi:hypothetical protein